MMHKIDVITYLIVMKEEQEYKLKNWTIPTRPYKAKIKKKIEALKRAITLIEAI